MNLKLEAPSQKKTENIQAVDICEKPIYIYKFFYLLYIHTKAGTSGKIPGHPRYQNVFYKSVLAWFNTHSFFSLEKQNGGLFCLKNMSLH